MDTIFTLRDDNIDDIKLNLDDLYEKKKRNDLNTLSVYKRILQRVHTRIKTTARQQANSQHCWYVVPEVIIGVPRYDHGACIAYLIDQLRDNEFVVRYTHPNLLFISWQHWMPGYVRDEIRKKTGITIDGNGREKVKAHQTSADPAPQDPNALMFGGKGKTLSVKKNDKEYRSIDTYKPSGNLIYNQTLLQRIEDKSK